MYCYFSQYTDSFFNLELNIAPTAFIMRTMIVRFAANNIELWHRKLLSITYSTANNAPVQCSANNCFFWIRFVHQEDYAMCRQAHYIIMIICYNRNLQQFDSLLVIRAARIGTCLKQKDPLRNWTDNEHR